MYQLFRLSLIFCLIGFSHLTSAFASSSALERYCTIDFDTGEAKYYDLRSLSLKSGLFEIKSGKDRYLINICSTTNVFKTLNNTIENCQTRTSVCLVNDESPEDSHTIAYLKDSKISKQNNNLIMSFLTADTKESHCENYQTNITFICNKTRALEKAPILTNRTNCSFEFEWQTSEACEDEHTILEPHYQNESLTFLIGKEKRIEFDSILTAYTLADIKYENDEIYDFVIGYKKDLHQKNYNFTIKDCKNSFVCQIGKKSNFTRSIAVLTSSTLKHANDNFHLQFTSNSNCGRALKFNVSVIFNFYCDEKQNVTKYDFVAENNKCHYVFNATNSKICRYENLFKEQLVISTSTMKPEIAKPVIGDKIKNDKKLTEKPKIESTTQSNLKPEDEVTKSSVTTENSINGLEFKELSNSSQSDNNSHANLFGFIILVIVSVVGIVLAVFSLINDDRRFVK